MKIRADFVTNSSSTSFVLIRKGDFDEASVLDLLGIPADSPLAELGRGLFNVLNRSVMPAREYHLIQTRDNEPFAKWLATQFSEPLAERVARAEAAGHQVLVGSLSSDEDETESFLCCECFEAENDSLYLNALECVW